MAASTLLEADAGACTLGSTPAPDALVFGVLLMVPARRWNRDDLAVDYIVGFRLDENPKSRRSLPPRSNGVGIVFWFAHIEIIHF